LKALKKIGFKLFLITGDSENNARLHLKDSILDFQSAYYDVGVVEKGTLVSNIKKEHGCCIYFGDGDNDLEAFNSSDISVSTVSASRFSKSTSDIQSEAIDSKFMVEMRSAALKLKGRQVQNYFLAATYNFIIITFIFFIDFSPGLAILAMSISSSLIVINSMRE
jgi:P-type E1-E2 ATPase